MSLLNLPIFEMTVLSIYHHSFFFLMFFSAKKFSLIPHKFYNSKYMNTENLVIIVTLLKR